MFCLRRTLPGQPFSEALSDHVSCLSVASHSQEAKSGYKSGLSCVDGLPGLPCEDGTGVLSDSSGIPQPPPSSSPSQDLSVMFPRQAPTQTGVSSSASCAVLGRSGYPCRAPDCLQSALFLESCHNGSADSEHDLAAMVHDFMENGSCGSDFPESSDSENGLVSGSRLFETLQAQRYNVSPLEKDVASILMIVASSLKEVDLVCLRDGAKCKGGCIRHLVVKHLQSLGYDAAVCISRWPNSGKVPRGEYEYIDVCFGKGLGQKDRLIVDMDFQSQFEIARPTHTYRAAVKLLPVIFVGSEEKLGQILQVMAEAGKLSLKHNLMPLPPWRTIDYMTAKWMSPIERQLIETDISRVQQSHLCVRTKQCVEQLRFLKLCVAAETDKLHVGKSPLAERTRALYLPKTRRSNSRARITAGVAESPI